MNQAAIVGACKTIGRLNAEIEALKAEVEAQKGYASDYAQRLAFVVANRDTARDAEIEALKAERDEARAEVNRLRDVLIERDAEVARLEGLIALAWCCEGDNCARYCPDAAMHAEARAIRARQA